MKPFKVMFGSKNSSFANPFLVIAKDIKQAIRKIEESKTLEYEGGGEVKSIEELNLEILD
ncbi:hypothetical protein [Leptospira johnsonii]|uniref:Uncharacterized protein n=1 Tax=Leptospira johnsonii TaxID=1917820 RepID=A0A2P2D7Q8_9LEPT|nr:hypothetical protein [Leptospira johnsonii]GBF40660.1 hypothetical protein LPTSP1_36780 [Leptospira johnsonii]